MKENDLTPSQRILGMINERMKLRAKVRKMEKDSNKHLESKKIWNEDMGDFYKMLGESKTRLRLIDQAFVKIDEIITKWEKEDSSDA